MERFLNDWVQGIVVAIILATIIEMLIPEGNNKKYVKIVIGFYILFTIISPIITKVTKKEIDFANVLDLENYGQEMQTYSHYESLETSNQKNIEEIYLQNLKSDMESRLEQKGYTVQSLIVALTDKETYSIGSIRIQLQKTDKEEIKEQEKDRNVMQVQINSIEIGTNVQQKTTQDTKQEMPQEEIKKVREYLASIYDVQEKNIQINSN